MSPFSKFFDVDETSFDAMEKQQTVNRLLTNILSDKLAESRDFYVQLFEFDIDYDSDWFVHLISNKGLEIGILSTTSDFVPPNVSPQAGGFYITLVVDDVDGVFEQCQRLGIPVLEPPRNLDYGQRRMLIQDPNGVVLDVSAPAGGA